LKVLALDLASASGWAFGSHELGIEASGIFSCKTQTLVYEKVKELIELYKPEMIFSCRPTARYNTIKKQSEIAGVVKLLCERSNIAFNDKEVDSRLKKAMLGNGRATKEEILEVYGGADDNEADARLMLDFATRKMKTKT